MGAEALILVTVMGLIALAGAAGAVVMLRRSWGVLSGAVEGPLALMESGRPRPIERPPQGAYAGWGRERRVAHWTRSIVRQGRSAAEAGAPAAAVFNPELVDQMRRTDPHIELLLPLVIADLADSEGVDPAQLCAAFARGTGVAVEVSPDLVEQRRRVRAERARV